VAKKDGNLVASKNSHGQVRLAISVEISHRNRSWRAHYQRVRRRLESPVAVTEHDCDVIRIVIGNREVRFPVSVEVFHRDPDDAALVVGYSQIKIAVMVEIRGHNRTWQFPYCVIDRRAESAVFVT